MTSSHEIEQKVSGLLQLLYNNFPLFQKNMQLMNAISILGKEQLGRMIAMHCSHYPQSVHQRDLDFLLAYTCFMFNMSETEKKLFEKSLIEHPDLRSKLFDYLDFFLKVSL